MALAVVRGLGEAGVPVAVLSYDSHDFAQASKYVVARAQVPNPVHDALAAAHGVPTPRTVVLGSEDHPDACP